MTANKKTFPKTGEKFAQDTNPSTTFFYFFFRGIVGLVFLVIIHRRLSAAIVNRARLTQLVRVWC